MTQQQQKRRQGRRVERVQAGPDAHSRRRRAPTSISATFSGKTPNRKPKNRNNDYRARHAGQRARWRHQRSREATCVLLHREPQEVHHQATDRNCVRLRQLLHPRLTLSQHLHLQHGYQSLNHAFQIIRFETWIKL